MNWRIKGIIQAGLSGVPGGVHLNTFLQRSLGDLRNFDHCAEGKVGDWQVFLYHMQELSISPEGLDYLEVGTGWYPTLPLCYALVGARTIRTFDVTRHLNEKLSFRLLHCLEKHLDSIALAGGVPRNSVHARYRDLLHCTTLESLLRCARIEYLSPHSAAATGLPDRSIDIVFSNSVLEHVPAGSIRAIMHESYRVLRPGGFAMHSVNCGDHYAYFDRSITPINYLSFSEAQWKPWNNSLLFQNRLRPADFLDLARQANLAVVLDKHTARPELLEALAQTRLSPEFQHYSPDQLAATSVDFVAQRALTPVSVQWNVPTATVAGSAGSRH